jgi:gas vesicle protein
MTTAPKSTSNSEGQNIKPGQIPVSTTGLPAAEGVSVDKIRDILFGNQMQDYDRRFTALEERLLQKINDLESESARNLSILESTVKKQLESLVNQFREEKDRRLDTDKELQRSLRETGQALEKRLGMLSDQQSRLERDFADQSGQQAQSLREEIKRKNEEMRSSMDKMFGELSNVKTERNLLAGLFVEIAKCLNQDLVPKGTQGGNGDHRPR